MLIVPVVPLATIVVTVVALITVTELAAVPPMLTDEVPVKLVPVIVMIALVPPVVGVNDVIVGAGIYVNVPALVAVPPGIVKLIVPVVPLATTAVTVVAFTTVTEFAAVPPMLTADVPVKLVPVMVTVAPVAPVAGAKDVMVGAGIKVKVPALVAVPPGVVTIMAPVVPFATTAVTVVAFTTVNELAAAPPMLTDEAPVKLLPVMVIVAPVAPVVGVKEDIVGVEI